jgi:hypothetical protein
MFLLCLILSAVPILISPTCLEKTITRNPRSVLFQQSCCRRTWKAFERPFDAYSAAPNLVMLKQELNSSETSCDKIKRWISKCKSILLKGGITLRPLSFHPQSFRPGHFVPWYISSLVISFPVISSPTQAHASSKYKISYTHSPEVVAGFLLMDKWLIVVCHMIMVTCVTPV